MKPNNFPLRPSLNGSEELYTQTNDIPQKFTLESAKAFITEPTDITYSELYNKIINEELVAGSWYRLTDYTSVNFLNGWETANNNPTPVDSSFIPREVVTGDSSEVLILQAVSSSEISPIGYSESFPQDIITYLPLVNKIGVNLSIQNGNTLPDSSTVSGFDLQWDGTNVYFNMPTGYPALYGHYFYLSCSFDGGSYSQDGTFEPLLPNVFCQYPNGDNKTMSRIRLENGGMKVILLDLEEADFNLYDTDTLYVDHIEALNDAYGWVTRRQDTQNRIDVPFDFRWKTYRRYECEIFGNITSISYSATGTTAADGDYTVSSYASTSVDGQNATFKVTVTSNSVTNVEILNKGRLYANGDILTIDGSQIGGVTIDDDVVITIDSINSNIGYWGIGDVFNGANTTGNFQDGLSLNWKAYQIYNLEIGGQGGADAYQYNGYCENVFLGGVYDCKIGSNFNSNTIGINFRGNTIGNDFQYNIIGDGFQSNTIGINFAGNTIGDSFQSNNIGNYFNSYNIGNDFNYNNIGNDSQSNTIGDNFTGNVIGDSFNTNTIGNSFQSNTIRDGFGNNTIGDNFNNNTIRDSFNSNTIGNSFNTNIIEDGFQTNTIGDSFFSNIIGNSFNSNIIGNSFNSNIIGNNSQTNTIGDSFSNNTIGNNFAGNTIGINFYQNIIRNSFNSNTIGVGFYLNTIGNDSQTNTIGDNSFNNTIGNGFQTNTIGDSFNSNTIGNGFQTNTIGDSFNSNTIENSFNSNTIGDNFNSNIIGNDFQTNTIGGNSFNNTIGNGFQTNTIGDNFQFNIIGNNSQTNNIGNSFNSNTIGDSFQFNTIGDSFSNNTIGNNFTGNAIGDNFTGNAIGDSFNTNTIGDNFQFNIIGNNSQTNTIGNSFNSNTIGISFSNNTIVNDFLWNTIKYIVLNTDFSLATHVYANYNCEIFQRSDNTLQLSYIDGTNTIQYAAINA